MRGVRAVSPSRRRVGGGGSAGRGQFLMGGARTKPHVDARRTAHEPKPACGSVSQVGDRIPGAFNADIRQGFPESLRVLGTVSATEHCVEISLSSGNRAVFNSLHASVSSRRSSSATTLLSMGPVHGSVNVAGKTKRIRNLLREHHDRPADGLQAWLG